MSVGSGVKGVLWGGGGDGECWGYDLLVFESRWRQVTLKVLVPLYQTTRRHIPGN